MIIKYAKKAQFHTNITWFLELMDVLISVSVRTAY